MRSVPRARLEVYHPPFTFTGFDLFGPLTAGPVYFEVTPSLEKMISL